ncbi:MAG: helix-turn-helix domain-containing protein [Anaerolineales bacterium]
MRKLTYRQQEFLSQFLDIYREIDRPIHYVTIAERLGLGKVTVYEMLRLLEERGLVRSEYEMNPGTHGPGRPAVLFQPTEKARQLISQLAGEPTDLENWQHVKEQILQALREGRAGSYEELLNNLLDRIPDRHSSLIFLTETIASFILLLATIPDAAGVRTLLERLRRIGFPQEIGLSALSGMGMALSLFERINRRATSILLSQIGKYEDLLVQLNEENRQRLSEFAREVARTLSL